MASRDRANKQPLLDSHFVLASVQDDQCRAHIALENEENKWKFIGEERDIRIHRMIRSNCACHFMRGHTTISCSVEEVWEMLEDFTNLAEYEAAWLGGRMVEPPLIKEDQQTRFDILHFRFKSPSPVSNRDVVFLGTRQVLEDGTRVQVAHSIEHPQVKASKGFVRADLIDSGFILKPTSSSSTEVTYVIQLDPKGWVPSWIANIVAKSAPLTLADMKCYMESGRYAQQARNSKELRQEPAPASVS